MGDIKMCSSCGNSIPVEAVFCPNCGQKQEALTQEPEKAVQTPEESMIPDVEEGKAPETISEADSLGASEAGDQPEQVSQQPPLEVKPTAQQQEPVSPRPEPAQQQPYRPAPAYAPPQQPYAQGFAQPQQPQPNYQQQAQPVQGYQQPYYGQQAQQPAAAPQKSGKKFPWLFAALWLGMLIFVGVWIFLWSTYPDSQKPIISVDTLRILAPVVSAVLLVYTLNLKLIVKKLKVIPTILLIISLLFSVFMFFSFELVEGDAPHDLIRPITEIFFELE